MKKTLKKTLSIILAILMVVTVLPMAVMPASAATEATDLPTGDVSYYEGVTQYFKYNNYLYKVTWGNYILNKTDGTKSVKLVGAGNYLACYPNGLGLCDYLNKEIGGLRATRCTISDLPKTINTSLNCFNEVSSRHIDTTKPIAVITCVGVNAPTWTWSDDKTSANAVFVSADGKAQVTIGVTVTSSTVAAENCQEKDKITYTASTTFNGTAYSDVKTEDGAAGPHIYNKEVATESYFKSAATCDNPAVYYKSCVCGACDKSATFNYGSALGHDEEPTYQDNGDGTHSAVYPCCGTTFTEPHSTTAEDDKEATCVAKAYCSVCDSEYGEVDITNHDENAEYDNGFCEYGCYEPAVLNGDVYEISNAGQLYWFSEKVNAGETTINGKLMKNIVVNEGTVTAETTDARAWTPIGNDYFNQYTGNFNGNGNTISGLYFNDSSVDNVGLFGYVGAEGKVQNVGVINSYISGNNCVGGVVGVVNDYCTVTNCYNTGTVSGTEYVGGVIGSSYEAVMTDCYNTGAVSGTEYVGGVVGYLRNGTVTGCYNTGAVSGGNEYVGGVAGYSRGTVNNCYNTGAVIGIYHIGGVVGHNDAARGGNVRQCYNIGTVTGRIGGHVGGVVGEGAAFRCYYLDTCGATGEGTAKTAEQFKSGEVAYLLNGSKSEGNLVWGQLIGTDSYPVFGGETVYYNESKGYYNLHTCDFSGEWKYDAYKHWKECECGLKSEEGTHSDSMVICTEKAVCETCSVEYEEKDKIIHDETVEYVNGFCPNCDDYEPAVDSDSDGYYEIGNAGQLYWFADKAKNDRTNYGSANAILTQNIVVNENVLTADGKLNGFGSDFRAWIPPYAYKGTFDGAGKTVSGLYFKDTEERDVGFIGYLYGGTVKNLTVKDSYFNAYSAVGGIVGSVIEGTVTDCFSSATVIAGSLGYAGGIAGENGAGLVERCANSGFVTSGYEAGGIVGYNHNYYDDPDPAIIRHCYNIGSVSGYTVGGIVGFAVQKMGSSVEIDSCWAACELNGTNSVGGLIGHASGSTIRCCSYDKTVFTGNPVGKKTSCNILDSGFKSTEEFASGAAAYLLNGKSSGGFWRQTIGTDAYPGFSGDKVYYGYISCADNAKKVYTNDATATEVKPAHNWSNNDGICANGCGYECTHVSYTGGVCDNCNYECPHAWGEGVLTRPVHDTVLGSKDGYYTYTCTVCDYEKKETVKSADYSAYEAVSEEINALLQSDELTDAAKQAIYSAANECGLPSNDLTESEQKIVDDLVAELEKIIADADEKIASGEYVKIDGTKEYNKIATALDEEILENYSQEEFAALAEKAGDEINARFGEIIEKAEALTGTVAENKDALAEIESEMRALYGEIKNCLDGVHNGFVYEVTEEAKCEVNAIESATCTLCGETDEREIPGTALIHSFTKYEETEAPKCGVAGKEVAYCDNGCQTTDERETPALEHIFLDYVSNGDATCTADGTKTASCLNGCGTTDTVADEGSMLDHTDEDGDKLCDDCGEEVYDRCDICGGKAHGDDKIQLVFCMIITIIRFVTAILKSIN